MSRLNIDNGATIHASVKLTRKVNKGSLVTEKTDQERQIVINEQVMCVELWEWETILI